MVSPHLGRWAMATFRFEGEVWTYDGPGGWCFVPVPKAESELLKASLVRGARGFGSIRIRAAIGGTEWETSIFPDAKAGVYQLPLKAEVRRREAIKIGDVVAVTIATHDRPG